MFHSSACSTSEKPKLFLSLSQTLNTETMNNDHNQDHDDSDDLILIKYQPSELKIAAEFLTNFLPFLSKDLCHGCRQSLVGRIRSLGETESNCEVEDSAIREEDTTVLSVIDQGDDSGFELSDDGWHCERKNKVSGWDDAGTGWESDRSVDASGSASGADDKLVTVDPPSVRMSWADMAQEDELGEGVDEAVGEGHLNSDKPEKNVPELSREQREYLRFMNVQRKKDFVFYEKIGGRIMNIVQGLELHTGVFSIVEQKKIVDYIYQLQEMGSKGELEPRTYNAPRKWMKGKGRITIQFGCCYNYALDKDGNPPGILKSEYVDPIPPLFKIIIKRLVGWHVLPPSCIPDSCIVNIYNEGDCIPPHIDNHDFVRPFCTLSFLSECNIVFGSNLKILDAGEFGGPVTIPLPIGSVLVLNGNGADVAKHCVPAVPTKRISITFRKMDDSKHPFGFIPEPDLQDLKPLPYDESKNSSPPSTPYHTNRPSISGVSPPEKKIGRGHYSEPVRRAHPLDDRKSRNKKDGDSWPISREDNPHVRSERSNYFAPVSSQGPSANTTGRGAFIAQVTRANLLGIKENRNKVGSYSDPVTSRNRRDRGNYDESVPSEPSSQKISGRGKVLGSRASSSENGDHGTDSYSEPVSGYYASRNSPPVSKTSPSENRNKTGGYTERVSRDYNSRIINERANNSEKQSSREVSLDNRNGRNTFTVTVSDGNPSEHRRNENRYRRGGRPEPVLRGGTSEIREERANYSEPVSRERLSENRSGRGAYNNIASRLGPSVNKTGMGTYYNSTSREGPSEIGSERDYPNMHLREETLENRSRRASHSPENRRRLGERVGGHFISDPSQFSQTFDRRRLGPRRDRQ